MAARNEKLLLESYFAVPPVFWGQHETCSEDKTARHILRKFNPVILNEFSPRSVYGDGNCFYRAASLGLYGDQKYHYYLRLLAALEVIKYREYYDVGADNYINIVNEFRIVTVPYDQLLPDILTSGSYADMMHIYATSAAINEPILSYYPPTNATECMSTVYRRKITGRNVRESRTPRLTIMWSQLNISDCSTFTANHFVYLEPHCRDDNDHRHQIIVSDDESERSEDVRNDTLGSSGEKATHAKVQIKQYF